MITTLEDLELVLSCISHSLNEKKLKLNDMVFGRKERVSETEEEIVDLREEIDDLTGIYASYENTIKCLKEKLQHTPIRVKFDFDEDYST